MITIRGKLRVLYTSSIYHFMVITFCTTFLLRILIIENLSKDFWSSFLGITFVISETINIPFSLIMLIYLNFGKATHISSLLKLSKLTNFLYSPKNQKEIFEAIIADWQEEYFEALLKKEIWKARWINVRYTCAFLAAMWQKSSIGDLIEFISKLAK